MVGESDVPLTEEIKPRKYDFFFNFLLAEGKLIVVSYEGNNENATIYTTPADKEFYLVACSVSPVSGANSHAIMLDNDWDLVTAVRDPVTNQHEGASQNFPIPLKLTSGQFINLRVLGGGNDAIGIIQGYELDVQRIAYK